MPKVYWFQRKLDDEYFPVEGEKTASTIYYRPGNKFKYLGWSNGTTYLKIISQKPKIKKESDEHIRIMEEGLDPERKKLAEDAFKAELKEALDNPDKTPPRNYNVMNLEGNIQQDIQIRNRLRG